MDEAAFKAIVSGERRGVGPALLRAGLAAASFPYGCAIRLRNAAFDAHVRRPHRAGVPVISVGNITTGGTGKTPFVAFVVDWLRERGRRPAILSRGYRSLDGQANDEKLVLDRLCPGVPHVQNRDRIAGAKTAIVEHAADAIVLDDAFQHRRLYRDLDVVLVDASNPWGYGRLLPRGLLREPTSGMRRAGLIVITRADQASAETLRQIRRSIEATGATAPVAEVAYPADVLVEEAGPPQSVAALAGKKVLAFCGIGNPSAFLALLKSNGMDVAEFVTYPDHHHYGPEDVARLRDVAIRSRVEAVVTTEKDLVKFGHADDVGPPLFAVRIVTRIVSGRQEIDDRLANAIR